MQAAWIYSLKDLAGAAWGVAVFASALVAPGFVLLQALGLTASRTWSAREKLAWSVAISFGPGILLLAGVVALGGASAGAALLGAFALAALRLGRRSWRVPARLPPGASHALCIFAVWTGIVLFSLVDLGVHGRLWMSVTAYDHGLRTEFVEAVLRTGAPPVDPVYWPGHDVPMRYYYFWYEVCAAVARLAHISARQALIASCVWPAAGVVAMLALYGRYMLGRRGRELTRLVTMASSLLWVCGLDLLVTVALHLIGTPVMPDMEWWSMDQVSSWPDTFLWVPHHAAALVAVLLGLLLLLTAGATAILRTRMSLAIAAGLSFAAAFGMSAYIAVGVVFLALAGLLLSVRRGSGWAYLQGLLVAGVTSGLALCRFLYQLTRQESTSIRSASPLYPGVREILDPAALARSRLFQGMALRHPWRAREVAALILLVPGWAVELGFYAVVLGVAVYRFRRSAMAERTLAVLAISGLAGASFLRSGVIATNDYGVRATLLAQFFLLLLGAMVFQSSAGKLKRFLWVLIVVGAGACVYQLIALRSYLPVQQASGNPELRDLDVRTYTLRTAYAAMRSRVPTDARLQFDPAETSFYFYPHLLYGGHQLITAEITCSTSFGGDPAACPFIQNGVRELFPARVEAAPSAAQTQQLCSALGVQYLVATRWDNVWQNHASWVWSLPATVEEPAVRIVTCGPKM